MRRRLAVLVVPLIMLAAAASHGIRVANQNQSPWMGGAFGMFATVDGPYRILELETEDETIRVPTSGNNDLRRAATYPTAAELGRLASTLMSQGVDVASLRILRPTYRDGYLRWEEAASYGG